MGAVTHDRRPVDLHGIGGEDPRPTARDLGQRLDETPVDLDSGHLGAGLEQSQRQRAEARPDLDNGVTRLHPRQPDDLADRVLIDDEVLSQRAVRLEAVPGHDLQEGGAGEQRRDRINHRRLPPGRPQRRGES